MKKWVITFLLGAVAGAGGLWYWQQHYSLKAREQNSQDPALSTNGSNPSWVQQLTQDLSVETIKKELAATSVVIREKAQQAGKALMDATENARITSTIKVKLLAEPGFPGVHINVDTTGGVVTLSGTVTTHDQIAKAMRIALETDGVGKVISTLQVAPAK